MKKNLWVYCESQKKREKYEEEGQKEKEEEGKDKKKSQGWRKRENRERKFFTKMSAKKKRVGVFWNHCFPTSSVLNNVGTVINRS